MGVLEEKRINLGALGTKQTQAQVSLKCMNPGKIPEASIRKRTLQMHSTDS